MYEEFLDDSCKLHISDNYTKMANQVNLEDPSSLSLVMSSSEEEEEVVVRGRPTSPEVPLQPKLLWSEGNAAYVYSQLLNISS